MTGQIGVLDWILEMVKKLVQELEASPTAWATKDASGGNTETTAALHQQLVGAASDITQATNKIVLEVDRMHDSVRAAVLALMATDQSAADDGKLILSMLDDVEAQAPSGPTSSNGDYT
ncbi:MAG: hypothetical protein JST33_01335 [Actinobacteria bacterium]|nr:hypothetical protein [Actinomycetota bacterium]